MGKRSRLQRWQWLHTFSLEHLAALQYLTTQTVRFAFQCVCVAMSVNAGTPALCLLFPSGAGSAGPPPRCELLGDTQALNASDVVGLSQSELCKMVMLKREVNSYNIKAVCFCSGD